MGTGSSSSPRRPAARLPRPLAPTRPAGSIEIAALGIALGPPPEARRRQVPVVYARIEVIVRQRSVATDAGELAFLRDVAFPSIANIRHSIVGCRAVHVLREASPTNALVVLDAPKGGVDANQMRSTLGAQGFESPHHPPHVSLYLPGCDHASTERAGVGVGLRRTARVVVLLELTPVEVFGRTVLVLQSVEDRIGGRPRNAVHGQAVMPLKRLDRDRGATAEAPVDQQSLLIRVWVPTRQAYLQRQNIATSVAFFQNPREGIGHRGCAGGNYQQRDGTKGDSFNTHQRTLGPPHEHLNTKFRPAGPLRAGAVYHRAMSVSEPVRVVLIDDHDLLRQGIKTMLESQGDVEVVGEASDGSQALQTVERSVPDVVVIDVIMPTKDGIEATREIKDAFPNIGVLVLSGHDEQQFVFDALKAGASGYLLKTAELDEVVKTVKEVAQGQGKLDPTLATRMLSEFQTYQKADVSEVFQPLTPREKEILRLMSQGLPNKTIASRLSISERTVTTHVANIYSKLHVNNRVSAIQEAMRRRILDYNP